jgi:hypothetical protein
VAKRGELTDVVEGVGDGTSEECFHRSMKRPGGGQVVVELLHGGEEASDFGSPGERVGVAPNLVALGHGEGPSKRSPKWARILAGARVVWLQRKLAKDSGAQ